MRITVQMNPAGRCVLTTPLPCRLRIHHTTNTTLIFKDHNDSRENSENYCTLPGRLVNLGANPFLTERVGFQKHANTNQVLPQPMPTHLHPESLFLKDHLLVTATLST